MGFASQGARIDHNMTLHPPQDPLVGDVYDEIRAGFKAAAHLVDHLVPDGREKSQALTDLEDGLMHAVAGIARNQHAILAGGDAKFGD